MRLLIPSAVLSSNSLFGEETVKTYFEHHIFFIFADVNFVVCILGALWAASLDSTLPAFELSIWCRHILNNTFFNFCRHKFCRLLFRCFMG